MDKFSYLGGNEIESVELMFQQFLSDPLSVDESWRKFFEGFEFARKNYLTGEYFSEAVDKEFKVVNLINAYRNRGHFFTHTNPVRSRRTYFPTLDIENYGLNQDDLTTVFQAGREIGIGPADLQTIISHLQDTYCRSIGVEYQYIREDELVKWLQERMERSRNSAEYTLEQKKHIYQHLVYAAGFERFIHKKFTGQKRFSLEGTETLIPALDAIIEKGAQLGIAEFVIGMAHRGRLNVLANILKKPYENIFREFSGIEYEEGIVNGDVKYHLGYNNTITTDTGNQVNLSLAPNPSHLEAVDSVVQGMARSFINNKYNHDLNKCAVISIHGDAAIAAQGVVYEVLQMSQLEGYKTGGTIHIVINNQVGFTTNYLDARSSIYCTDVGKTVKSPVFHVNGDDVEALIYTVCLALEFRQVFHRDVFIDILSYRKYGHNEGDEPRFTQPLLYKAIEAHPNPRDIYAEKLISLGVLTKDVALETEKEFDEHLSEKYILSQQMKKVPFQRFMSDAWKDFHYADEDNIFSVIETGVPEDRLKELASAINFLPPQLKFFSKIVKLTTDRAKMIAENRTDWAMAELMAYASLLREGFPVRLSGQDSVRGTFSQRHAGYIIEDTDQVYYPLKNLPENKADFSIYNSLLSEYGVLGFEYGYSLATPDSLTIWEAQYGDFYNGAQIIIDQYVSSSEDKWGIMNGLALYLPHGYEGQGSEHSSARLERFLTLCANFNMQIVNCTTPANFFHVLRRQMHRQYRIPLVILTPKSLLRHPACISELTELSNGHFMEVIDDQDVNVDEVTRLVFCSGKIYYDLLERKQQLKVKDIALVRIEQLYPFPKETVLGIVRKYSKVLLHLWVQEEPENMGAWHFIRNQLPDLELEPVTRLASGSPAVGLYELHKIAQAEIIQKVFRKCDCELHNNYCGLQCVIGKSREEIRKQHRYL
ncbi:MAG: 2-oxoglutarate dehydrogenase E1 component [Bacteroidia bacterium]|nr:2-oxoglutarate dehydrogenase E1 component [Bacteroidia bacterium]